MIIVAGVIAWIKDENYFSTYNYTIFCVYGIITFVLLTIAVLYMRQTIKSTDCAIPKDKLVTIHIVNFVTYLTFLVSRIILNEHVIILHEKVDTSEADKVAYLKAKYADYVLINVFDWVYTYMYVFLLYLVSNFAKESVRAEKRDVILDRNVPNIVYLMNIQLLKAAVQLNV